MTAPLTDEDRLERRLGNGPHDVDQKTFRSIRNRQNNYLLDRHVQKTESFTGIDGINTQDRAIQEGMGPVVDRSREHLGPADRAINQARRLLLEAVKTVTEGGSPRGVEPTYSRIRSRPVSSGIMLSTINRSNVRSPRSRWACLGSVVSTTWWPASRSARPNAFKIFSSSSTRRIEPRCVVI